MGVELAHGQRQHEHAERGRTRQPAHIPVRQRVRTEPGAQQLRHAGYGRERQGGLPPEPPLRADADLPDELYRGNQLQGAQVRLSGGRRARRAAGERGAARREGRQQPGLDGAADVRRFERHVRDLQVRDESGRGLRGVPPGGVGREGRPGSRRRDTDELHGRRARAAGRGVRVRGGAPAHGLPQRGGVPQRPFGDEARPERAERRGAAAVRRVVGRAVRSLRRAAPGEHRLQPRGQGAALLVPGRQPVGIRELARPGGDEVGGTRPRGGLQPRVPFQLRDGARRGGRPRLDVGFGCPVCARGGLVPEGGQDESRRVQNPADEHPHRGGLADAGLVPSGRFQRAVSGGLCGLYDSGQGRAGLGVDQRD